MKLSDEEIGALLQCLTSKPLDVTITQPVSNLMSVNIHDAIRQLMEERDKYKEVCRYIANKGWAATTTQTSKWINEFVDAAKQVLEESYE